MDVLPARVLGLHRAIAPVLTLLLARCPLLLSVKVSAVGSLGLDLGLFFLVVCLFFRGFLFVCLLLGDFFGGFFCLFL